MFKQLFEVRIDFSGGLGGGLGGGFRGQFVDAFWNWTVRVGVLSFLLSCCTRWGAGYGPGSTLDPFFSQLSGTSILSGSPVVPDSLRLLVGGFHL